jgi:hypothetical protein
VDPGTVAVDLPASIAPDTRVELVVRGVDPWLGAPLATVVDGRGGALTHVNGSAWTSDDLPFSWYLEVVPPYSENAVTREFRWHLYFPTTHPVAGAGLPFGTGPHHVRVELPGGDVVESGPFSIE